MMFTEELSWLQRHDWELLMGEAICTIVMPAGVYIDRTFLGVDSIVTTKLGCPASLLNSWR